MVLVRYVHEPASLTPCPISPICKSMHMRKHWTQVSNFRSENSGKIFLVGGFGKHRIILDLMDRICLEDSDSLQVEETISVEPRWLNFWTYFLFHLCDIISSFMLIIIPWLEPWSIGYGRRLVFWRLWVQIPAPYTGWTFFTYICCKNSNKCLFEKSENKR